MEKSFESPMEILNVETSEETILMLPTDQAQIFNLLDKCSKSIVEGYDFISSQILSLAALVLAQPVTYVTTKWLSESVFANVFQTAKVLPIYKLANVVQSKTIDLYQYFLHRENLLKKLFSPDFSILWSLTIYFAESKRVFEKICQD